MKFDVIVGNPPYLKGLWRQFLYDSARLSKRYVAMIAPNGTDNLSDHSDTLIRFLCENGIQAKLDCTDAFPTVSSGKIVTYFLDKQLPHNPLAVKDTSITGDIMDHLFKHNDGELISRRVIQGRYEIMNTAVPGIKRNKNTDLRSNTELPDERHTVRVLTSSAKEGVVIRYFQPDITPRRIVGDGFALNRFFGTGNTVANYISAPDGISVSSNVLWFPAQEGETVESFLSVFGSKLYRLALVTIKNGQTATTPKNFRFLPCPPLTRIYTEAELYDLLDITNPDWIQFIGSQK